MDTYNGTTSLEEQNRARAAGDYKRARGAIPWDGDPLTEHTVEARLERAEAALADREQDYLALIEARERAEAALDDASKPKKVLLAILNNERALAGEYHDKWIAARDALAAMTAERDGLAAMVEGWRKLLNRAQIRLVSDAEYARTLGLYWSGNIEEVAEKISVALAQTPPAAVERVRTDAMLRECWEDYFQAETMMDTPGWQELAIDKARNLLSGHAALNGKEQGESQAVA